MYTNKHMYIKIRICIQVDERPPQAPTSSHSVDEEGWVVEMPEGEHTLSDIQRRGVSEKANVRAIRVTQGFEVTLFEFSQYSGKMLYLTAGDYNLTVGPAAFPRVGAMRTQRLRHSELGLRSDVDKLQTNFDEHTLQFASQQRDLLAEMEARGNSTQSRMEAAIRKLEERVVRLDGFCEQYTTDIEHLRKTKAEKGENQDLPDQIVDLRERLMHLHRTVDEETEKIATKADKSAVADKVSRDEIEEFVQAIQQLLKIGGPYAYTGHKLHFDQGAAEDADKDKAQGFRKARDKTRSGMNFVPLSSKSPPLKVWANLPRQFGGIESVWVDHGSTALGRGVHLKKSPSEPRFGGIAPHPNTYEGSASARADTPESRDQSRSPQSQHRQWVEDRQLPRRGPVSSPPKIALGLDGKTRDVMR